MKTRSAHRPLFRLSTLCAGVALIALSGCSSKSTTTATTGTDDKPALAGPSTDAAASGLVKVVNAHCAVMPDHPTSANNDRMVPPTLTRTWRGQAVGFCCDDCPSAWDAMSAKEKDESLAATMKAPAN